MDWKISVIPCRPHLGANKLKYYKSSAVLLKQGHFSPKCTQQTTQTCHSFPISPLPTYISGRQWVWNIDCGIGGTHLYLISIYRPDSRFVPSQWETSLQSKAVSNWLGPNPVFPKSCQHVCFVRRRIQMSDTKFKWFVKIISIWCLSVQFGRRSMKSIREDCKPIQNQPEYRCVSKYIQLIDLVQ